MISITFDTDHMSETRLKEWFERQEIEGYATFFCTEAYGFLSQSGHEVAPHPDFSKSADFIEVVDSFKQLFPEATSWRSHSLVFSQQINVELFRIGYERVSTIETWLADTPRPYRLPWGMTQYPIYYMDNSDFCNFNGMHPMDHVPFSQKIINDAVNGSGVYVFDFHPIHLQLNTPNYAFYRETRDAFLQGGDVAELRYDGRGTASFFDELMSAMRQKNMRSHTLAELG